MPKGSHEKSSNFKPASRAPKVMNMRPKATQNHNKLTLKSTEFQLLCKVGFCNPSHTKCLFLEPQTSRFRSPNRQKNDLETSMNKRQLFSSKVPKKLSKQGPEIDLKSIKTQAWTPRSPFLCSKVPLDRPKVPQDAKVRQQACLMTGFGHQE